MINNQCCGCSEPIVEGDVQVGSVYDPKADKYELVFFHADNRGRLEWDCTSNYVIIKNRIVIPERVISFAEFEEKINAEELKLKK